MQRGTLFLALVASHLISPSSSTAALRGTGAGSGDDENDGRNIISSGGGRKMSSANADYVHEKRSSRVNLFDSDDGGRSRSALDKESRIIGGTFASTSEFPYLVSMQDFGHFCGGSLIAPDIVLTAAHCLGGDYKVIFGRYNLSYNSGQSILKDREVEHPNYDASRSDNDFGLVILAKEVTNARVVRLNENDSYPNVGTSVTVAGWGDTTESDAESQLSDALMRVNVNVISNADCEDSSDGRGSDYYNQITESMLCATYGGGGKDACQGDSGGPLSVTNGGVDIQVGVVSWGIGCGTEDFPGVYSRVSSAYPWIRSVVCDNSKNPPASFNCVGGGGGSVSGGNANSDGWTSIFATDFTNGLGPFTYSGTNVQRLNVAQSRTGVMQLQHNGKMKTKELDVEAYSRCQSIVNFKMLRMVANEGWCVDYSTNAGVSYVQVKCFKGLNYSVNTWYDNEKVLFSVEGMDSIHLRFRCMGTSATDDVYVSRAKLQCKI